MIVGNNSLLNQYVPTFFIKDLLDGQGLIYDSTRRAFVNADINGGSGGATHLGQLLDVSPSVDNPLSLQNGQALVYNSFTSLWENKFVDYNTILNKPDVTGTNTGDQTITLSGDATGVSTNLLGATSLPVTLATVNLSPGTYGDSFNNPVITVNSKGLVTLITTVPIQVGIKDLVDTLEVLTVAPRYQYIVTSQLEVDGYIVNNGVIAIL